MDDLLSDSEASASPQALRVNRAFAQDYDRRKRKLELARAKDLLQDEEDDESSSEEEDEDAALLSTDLDLQIINTINSIKRKDPKIYDKSTKWFEGGEESDGVEESGEEEDSKRSKSKKTFKDVAREQLLAGDGGDSDAEEGRKPRRSQLLYDQEQAQLRKAFLAAVDNDNETGYGSDGDDMLHVKEKSAEEEADEERRLKKALDEMKSLAMQDTKEKPEQVDFLTTYLSKKMWKQPVAFSTVEEEEEEDEEEMEAAELFESKYNFRFEQIQDEEARKQAAEAAESGDLRAKVSFDLSSASAQVRGHARQAADSVRRVDDKRKLQREQRKERKEKEKRQKEAELRRLKNLKRQELQERLRRIADLGGLKDLPAFDESILDEDWDPAKHEALMNQQFGEDYYAQNDEDLQVDEELGDPLAAELGGGGDYDEENVDQVYDAQYDAEGYEEGGEGEEVDLEAERQAVRGMVQDLYALDYEDIVAGLPCRFKYREVPKEDFGLSAEDILLAEDDELNHYVSLKKLAPYDTRRSWDDQKLSKKRKRLRTLVKERKQQLEEEERKKEEAKVQREQKRQEKKEAQAETEEEGGKRKRRRRKRKDKQDSAGSNSNNNDHDNDDDGEEES
jgi:protein KRI1